MKRCLVLLFVSFFILLCRAQTSVAGVRLTDEYDNVRYTLEQRYGYDYIEESNSINYFDITIGGMFFQLGRFEFEYRNNARRLNYVEFNRRYELSELNKAKKELEEIAKIYRKKYHDIQIATDKKTGFKIFRCCYDPERYIYDILITLSKDKARSGKTYYFVTVEYGPWWTIENDDF